MNIKQLQKLCHRIAKEKGFWGYSAQHGYGIDVVQDRNNGELIALMHSELSEALEELRKPMYNYDLMMKNVGEELADCVIRILDFCGGRNIDLQTLLEKKIKKNKKRPFKHGKKF